MQDPLSKANRYRQEAARCYELAKSSSPGFLGDCYRRVAVQYLFMAEGETKLAEQDGRLVPEQATPQAADAAEPAPAFGSVPDEPADWLGEGVERN
jgi:hypothetical protein